MPDPGCTAARPTGPDGLTTDPEGPAAARRTAGPIPRRRCRQSLDAMHFAERLGRGQQVNEQVLNRSFSHKRPLQPPVIRSLPFSSPAACLNA